MRETVARLGVSDAKQAGRVVGEIMKAHKGKLEPATVKRIVDEELGAPEEPTRPPPVHIGAGSSSSDVRRVRPAGEDDADPTGRAGARQVAAGEPAMDQRQAGAMSGKSA